MPDDDDIEAALRLAGVPRDPVLQTGPFPQWPTLPPLAEPESPHLERPQRPYDVLPDNASLMDIFGALLAAGKLGRGRRTSTPADERPSILAPSEARPRLYPSNPVAGVPELNDWDAVRRAANPEPWYGQARKLPRMDMDYGDTRSLRRIPGGPGSYESVPAEAGDPGFWAQMPYRDLISNREYFAQELAKAQNYIPIPGGKGEARHPASIAPYLKLIDDEIATRRSSSTPKLYADGGSPISLPDLGNLPKR